MMNLFTEMQYAQRYKILSSVTGSLLCIFALAVFCQAQPGAQLSPAAKTAFEKNDFAPCIKEYTALISRVSNDDAAYGERAKCHLLKAESDAKVGRSAAPENALALSDAEKAISLNPVNLNGYFVRGKLRRTANEIDGSLADFTKIFEIDPKNIDALMERARTRRLKKDLYYNVVNADLTPIFKIDPNYLPLYELASQYCLEDNGGDSCLNYIQGVIELKPNDISYRHKYATVVLALASYVTNREVFWKQAADYLQRDVDSSKFDLETVHLLGKLYVQLKNNQKAEEIFAQGIAIYPKNADSYVIRGDYYRLQGKKDQAITDYAQAIKVNPQAATAYRNRGIAFYESDDYLNAVSDFTKAVTLDPKDGLAFMNRGNLYYIQKDYEKALADLNQAVALKAADPCVNMYRGRIFMEKGDYNAAHSDIWINQIKCGMNNFYLGELEFRQKQYGSAIMSYGNSLKDFDYHGYDKTPVLAALKLARQAEQESREKNTVVTAPPVAVVQTNAVNPVPSGNSETGGIVNQTVDEWIESFKQQASFNGRTILNEGTADKLIPYQKSLSQQLLFGASDKHYVLLVFTDDPTYDSFVFVNGEIVTNPVNANGYYVSAPKITNLLNNQYINAVSLGFNSVSRIISVEFRADKPGKVRYILFTQPSETERNNNVASNKQLVNLLNSAAGQFNQKNYAEAIKSYTECLRLKPDVAQCFQLRSFAYFKLKKYQESISDSSKVIELEPNNAVSYATRADSYLELQYFEQAVSDYSKAIQINPQNGVLYNGRGSAYQKQKKYNEAIADHTKSIEIKPEAYSYYNRGNDYLQTKRYDEAIADYSKSIQLDVNYTDSYYNRGVAYYGLKRYEEAIAEYTKAIQIDSQYVYAYNGRGALYYVLKRYDEAIVDFTKAIQINPNYADPYGNRASVYFNIQKYEEAIIDSTKAIELKSQDASIYNNRRISYCKLGKIAEAQADERKIIELGGKVTNPCR